MHSFLRAIGFSKVKTRDDLNQLIRVIQEESTDKKLVQLSENIMLQEISKKFAENIGISLRGETDSQGEFHLEHYYPYYNGSQVSTIEEVLVNKKVDTESYTGMCDDNRIGVSLIFYLQNIIEYLDDQKLHKDAFRYLPVKLSALSIEGKVLLGLENNSKKIRDSILEVKRRDQLMTDAKRGNQEAIDSLTLDDIDAYAMITRRSRYEDVYSIVESSFIPYGSESDNYSIIGDIMECDMIVNDYTGEELYQLLIQSNDIVFNVCINKDDLLGEPLVGRRFKGNIWMQGYVDFAKPLQ